MNKSKLFLISLLGGVLLSLAWLDLLFAPVMLVAFVPFLVVEEYLSRNLPEKKPTTRKFFLYCYLPLLIWNFTTTYWVAYSTPLAIALPFVQAALMSLVMQAAHYCKRSFAPNKEWGNIFFALFFLAFEYLHLHWDINFPWLNLGNSFSKYPCLVQWYEYTGVAGGTLWIWLCNMAVFELVCCFVFEKKKSLGRRHRNMHLALATAVVLVPCTISLIRWFTFNEEDNKSVQVVVVQPNLDPYSDQYDFSPRQVCDRVIELARQKADSKTDYIVCPESCLQDYAWEHNLEASPSISYLREFENKYPKAEIIAGMSSRRLLPYGVKTKAARSFADNPYMFYESCNIAVKIDRDTIEPQSNLRHKSVLTPFVEKMPFKSVLGFLGDLALDLGGTVGTLGSDPEAVVFASEGKPKTAVAICYESTDGQYIGEFVAKGAELIFIITNDGWWKDTPGNRQHAAFASLRAIETRRPIARSANTGISCFVSPKGEQSEQTAYWQQAVIKQELVPQKALTFYVRHGDYIYRASAFFAVMFFLLSFVISKLRKADKLKIQPK